MTESVEVTARMVSSYSVNPSLEHLLADLVSYRHTLELLGKRYQDDVEQRVRLQLCAQKLDEAEAAITKRPLRRIFLAWDLFHQVSEELILLLNRAELAAEGAKAVIDIKLSAIPEISKSDWIARLEAGLKKLGQDNPSDGDVQSARQTIKMAMNALNSQTDNLFWDIWSKKLAGLIYTVLLLAGLAAFVYVWTRSCGFGLCIGNILLLGAMGGVASGIISADQQYIAKGHFWVSTLYYSLVRPTQGALAALIVFWMLQSQYLVKIDPPINCKDVAFSCLSCPQAMSQGDNAGVTSQGDANKSTLIVLNTVQGKQIYLYLLVLLLAGFSGDKVLKTVSDKTITKLFVDAEKTKEAK